MKVNINNQKMSTTLYPVELSHEIVNGQFSPWDMSNTPIREIGARGRTEQIGDEFIFQILESEHRYKEVFGTKCFEENQIRWIDMIRFNRSTGVISSDFKIIRDLKYSMQTLAHIKRDGLVKAIPITIRMPISNFSSYLSEESVQSQIAAHTHANNVIGQKSDEFEDARSHSLSTEILDTICSGKSIVGIVDKVQTDNFFAKLSPKFNFFSDINEAIMEMLSNENIKSVDEAAEIAMGDEKNFLNEFVFINTFEKFPEFIAFMMIVLAAKCPIVSQETIPPANLTILLDIAIADELEGVEKLVKSFGFTAAMNQLEENPALCLSKGKLNKIVQLPKTVIDFLVKTKQLNLLTSMQVIGRDDPNEALEVIEWYNLYSEIKNFRSNIEDFAAFVSYLGSVKENYPQVSMFVLLNYLASQAFWFSSEHKDKFKLPFAKLQKYRDYLNLGGWEKEHFPSNLESAESILARNSDILLDKESCFNFESLMKSFKKYEYAESKYCVVAPTVAQDMVDEGVSLKHCVSSYVKLVNRGEERVLFVRNSNDRSKSLYTMSFDEDYNIIQFKEVLDANVTDTDAIKFLNRWKEKMKGLKE